MRKECEPPLRAGQPALIVTCGNTTRKYRVLDRDLIVLGRASTCDVGLTCSGVAPVHCILVRTADGWCIRDCAGGRSPTRINGRPIHEEALHDADVLQVGTFSFEVRLPTSRTTPLVGSISVVDERLVARLKRLQRARRNLIRLALKLRQRARKSISVPPTLAELERQAECLRGMQRDYQDLLKEYESRLRDLEKAEREVCDAREAFERECAERQTRLEQAEYDMARRRIAEESRLQLCWEECRERCQRAEQDALGAVVDHDRAVRLDRRSEELNHFARYLNRCRQQLLKQTERLRDEGRIAKDRSIRENEMSERLARLLRLKQELACTNSPSAPGNQLRADAEFGVGVESLAREGG